MAHTQKRENSFTDTVVRIVSQNICTVHARTLSRVTWMAVACVILTENRFSFSLSLSLIHFLGLFDHAHSRTAILATHSIHPFLLFGALISHFFRSPISCEQEALFPPFRSSFALFCCSERVSERGRGRERERENVLTHSRKK